MTCADKKDERLSIEKRRNGDRKTEKEKLDDVSVKKIKTGEKTTAEEFEILNQKHNNI